MIIVVYMGDDGLTHAIAQPTHYHLGGWVGWCTHLCWRPLGVLHGESPLVVCDEIRYVARVALQVELYLAGWCGAHLSAAMTVPVVLVQQR